MKTFLQLVNEAIRESKVTLDPLTSANFASPPRTQMYDNFKTWVNRAYKELILSRKEWQFRTERASVAVWPRLHLAGLSAAPVVGEQWEGVSSGIQFKIKEIFTFEDVEDNPDLEYTVSIELLPGYHYSNFIFREDVISYGVPDKTGYIKGAGRYDFRSLVPRLEDIDLATVELSNTPANIDQGGGFVNNVKKLRYAQWEKWALEYEYAPWAEGTPEYITETSQGTYDLYPRPDREYIISFDFTRMYDQLVNHNDMPTDIPEQYEDYLVWGAVMEYADFDSNPKVGARALKKLEKYNYLLERDFLEMPRFEGSRFYTY